MPEEHLSKHVPNALDTLAMYINILSLDAPVVAVLWCALLAQAAKVSLPAYLYILLGAAVWLAYAADRWMDARRMREDALIAPRHRFYRRHSGLLLSLWVGVLGGSLLVAGWRLPAALLVWASLYAVLVGIYLVTVQFSRNLHAIKEITGGLIFAVGCGWLLWAYQPISPLGLFSGQALLVLLCVSNLSLLALWDRPIDRAQRTLGMARQPTRLKRLLHACLKLALLASLGLFFIENSLALAGLFTTLCLLLLAALRTSSTRLRPLVDSSLATGALLGLITCWL